MPVSTARGRVNSLERSQDRYQCQSAQQGDRSTALKEVKTVINASQHSKGTGQQHSKKSRPLSMQVDTASGGNSIHTTRSDTYLSSAVKIFRLRMDHNRLNRHLITKFRNGMSELCPCQTGSMTTEYLLHLCPLQVRLQ